MNGSGNCSSFILVMFVELSMFQGLYLATRHRVVNKKEEVTVVMEITFLWEKNEDNKYK